MKKEMVEVVEKWGLPKALEGKDVECKYERETDFKDLPKTLDPDDVIAFKVVSDDKDCIYVEAWLEDHIIMKNTEAIYVNCVKVNPELADQKVVEFYLTKLKEYAQSNDVHRMEVNEIKGMDAVLQPHADGDLADGVIKDFVKGVVEDDKFEVK